MNWYLLKTKPNAHLVAREQLIRQGFEVFLPLLEKTAKRREKFVINTVPLFPSYLFVGTLRDQVPWKSINSTRGVSKAVTLDGTYRAINVKLIENLKCRCDEEGFLIKKSEIVTGDQVRIEKGPFSDFICRIEEIADNQRAWVLIDILQKQTRANISIFDLSKVG